MSIVLLSGTAHGATVALQNVNLGGAQETVYWEAGRLASGPNVNMPSSGVGTIAPVSPGYSASAGYYSWGGNYGLVASTSIQNTAILTDIQNVVFQQVAMGTGVNGLTFNGGPQLQLFNGTTLLDVVIPSPMAGMGPGVAGSGGGFDGTYSSSMFQWDLSGISEVVTSVKVASPIPVHASTIEARIDISGSSFVQVVPEPSSALLGGLGFLAIFRRRR